MICRTAAVLAKLYGANAERPARAFETGGETMRTKRTSWTGHFMGRALAAMAVIAMAAPAAANPPMWAAAWPDTDFTKHAVDWGEIKWGGVPKDGIRSIDKPRFVGVSEAANLADTEPVIGLVIDGDARAYPLGVLTRHEIVNDTVGGVPVAVTYCPLCNSAVVFDRRLDGRVLEFGVSGFLRNSDLIMYDRQTESWWQQFVGEAIVGDLTGELLDLVPARVESFGRFRSRAPKGRVLDPRGYGINPYAYYDTRDTPYGFFTGPFPEGIEPMVRVVVVDGEAWSLPLLRQQGRITWGELVLTWEAGQNSALDARRIAEGRDVGNVVVRRVKDGQAEDAVYDVTFAFVYHAFHPDRAIRTR